MFPKVPENLIWKEEVYDMRPSSHTIFKSLNGQTPSSSPMCWFLVCCHQFLKSGVHLCCFWWILRGSVLTKHGYSLEIIKRKSQHTAQWLARETMQRIQVPCIAWCDCFRKCLKHATSVRLKTILVMQLSGQHNFFLSWSEDKLDVSGLPSQHYLKVVWDEKMRWG